MDLSGIDLRIVTPVNIVKHDEWSDDKFTVEAIFADFTAISDLTLELSKEITPKMSNAISAALSQQLETMFTDWAKYTQNVPKGEIPFMFGAAKTPKQIGEYNLKPTASTYSVTKEVEAKGVYQRGCVHILLQMEVLPLVAATGAGVFDTCLCPKDELVLTISSYAISKSLLEP